MTYLLFPGRHLLNTVWQERYLYQVLRMPLESLHFWQGQRPPPNLPPIDRILFAVTSANQAHSRYNPIPFHVRAIGVDRFAAEFKASLGVTYRILGIPHFDPTPRFASYILKEIEEQTEGDLELTPANTVVLCSTAEVIQLFTDLGFAVLPAEAGIEGERPDTPTDVLKKIVELGADWAASPYVRQTLSPATLTLWQDLPDIPRRVIRLWRDPLLNDEGSLTETRDYAAYAYGMGNREIIGLKYADIKEAIVPGKIVDEGCADGALLVPIAKDYPDSDLIGIEITGEFLARCHERLRAGDFGGSYVHFHQRNITEPIFEDNAIDTTICNSTVHELWSYGRQAATVHAYFANKYRQTARGGRLLIRDVVGPEDKEQEVYLWLNDQDGRNENIFANFAEPADLATHLSGLSTYARFLRFARDFLAEARAEGQRGPETAVRYREATIDGRRYIVLPLKDAAEYIAKKDYTDNWQSEAHEEFTFWSFSEWKAALSAAGFEVVENPNEPAKGSRVYTNPWIVSNRFVGKVALYRMVDGRLEALPYPPTNIVLVGQKSI